MKTCILLLSVLAGAVLAGKQNPTNTKELREETVSFKHEMAIPTEIKFLTPSQQWLIQGNHAIPGPPAQVTHPDTTVKPRGVFVYSSNYYPLNLRNPFNLYAFPRVFDMYQGLQPPYNLNHPTGYRFGMNPFATSNYGPNFGFSDPFANGIYGGFSHSLYGFNNQMMMNPYMPQPGTSFVPKGFGMRDLDQQQMSSGYGAPGVFQNGVDGVASGLSMAAAPANFGI